MSSISRTSVLAFILVATLAVPTFAPMAKADSVTYTFSGINSAAGDDGLTVAFRYTSPGFVMPNPPYLALLASQLDSCTNCYVSKFVPAVTFQAPSLKFGDQIDFSDYLKVESVYAFPLGAFETPGTFYSTSPFSAGTLVVSSFEPTTLLLLACGLLLMGVSLRR